MKLTLLGIIMISGLLFSASSIYLSKTVFADDQWSSIAQRQAQQAAQASTIYGNKYQFDNLSQAGKNWSGLTSTTTDENSKGRDLQSQAQMSLENALATFNKIHIQQLQTRAQNTGYPGLVSVTTDEQARDRNTMISQARTSVDSQVSDLVSQLSQIQSSYSSMSQVPTTDESSISRQAQIEKTWDQQESKATDLINSIWQLDENYVNIQAGPTTNEQTTGRQLAPAQAYALSKAIQIFEEIHAQKLAAMQSSQYKTLSSTPTNEFTYYQRNPTIEQAREYALENALRVYNSYYPLNDLNATLYP